jgi:GntR family transcriptional regulator
MSGVTAGQPAYQRVAAAIRADIDGGRWGAGEQMPTEAQLAEDFSVSRNTIRQSLELLHSWNLVTRRQGSGTFVAPHGLSHAIGELKSLTDVMRERGMHPGNRDLACERDLHPPADAVDFLRSSTVWRVSRLRTADDRPFCQMRSWLPDHLGSQLEQDRLEKSGSLYRTLADDQGVVLSEATEVIRAESATAEEAATLDILRGAALIVIYRWVSDNRGRPVEYARAAAPGDRYQYLAKLRA